MRWNSRTRTRPRTRNFPAAPYLRIERKTYFSLTIVWTGFVFVITSMMAGGGLAVSMDFKHIILATLGGNVFLSIIAVLISIIACKTGLTFALLTRYSFGSTYPRRLPSSCLW